MEILKCRLFFCHNQQHQPDQFFSCPLSSSSSKLELMWNYLAIGEKYKRHVSQQRIAPFSITLPNFHFDLWGLTKAKHVSPSPVKAKLFGIIHILPPPPLSLRFVLAKDYSWQFYAFWGCFVRLPTFFPCLSSYFLHVFLTRQVNLLFFRRS